MDCYDKTTAKILREKANGFLSAIRFGNIKIEPKDKDEPVVYRATFLTSDEVLKSFNALVSYCEEISYAGYLFYTKPGYFTFFVGKFHIVGFLGTTINEVDQLVQVMKVKIVDYSLSEKVLDLYHATPGFDLLELVEVVLSEPYIKQVRDNIEGSDQPNFVDDLSK